MSPRPICLALALSFSWSAFVRAEQAAPPQTDPVPPYTLKKRSTFTAADSAARPPFWPIGWVKRAPNIVAVSQAAPEPRAHLDVKNFRVTSIMIGAGTTPSMAVINGRAYSEGEFLRMPKAATTPPVRVRVQRIADGTVVLQNADQTLVASLARPELAERKAEELLLDFDR